MEKLFLHLGGAARSIRTMSRAGAPEARARAASSGVRGDMVRVGRAARRGREVGHIRMLSRAAARRDPGTGQRAGWRGASGYMSGALGLLSHWFDSGDVRCARAAARVRATRFQPERVGPTPRLLWASPCGRALAGRWRTIPAAARGCPGRSRAGGGASRRSNRSPEAARVLSESQSKRCRSFADGSPDVRAMRSPRDLARGGARAVVGGLD